jgi:hypothetical protein
MTEMYGNINTPVCVCVGGRGIVTGILVYSYYRLHTVISDHMSRPINSLLGFNIVSKLLIIVYAVAVEF